jgi:hypothetical protein
VAAGAAASAGASAGLEQAAMASERASGEQQFVGGLHGNLRGGGCAGGLPERDVTW